MTPTTPTSTRLFHLILIHLSLDSSSSPPPRHARDMPQLFENDIIYDYSPAHTLNYLHRKYPNPFATHVVSVDTIDRRIDPDSGHMRSERVIGVKQGAPKWITKVSRDAHPPGSPAAVSTPARRIRSRDRLCGPGRTQRDGDERQPEPGAICLITYTPYPRHSANPKQTLFHQHALLLSAFPTAMIARRIEKASLDRFGSNAGVGKQGFEWVLAGGQSRADKSGQ
ncbi:hypothetical protein EHS25_009660 [Saitozyma podzolica]|uniref:PRELI/MSF1 domain-containing protein n=1 Tax=Saitozyma podzolica TaxID=1890683 RepID=A0A427YJW2_9TREE|nr:hypothetical protein EHS25_009660 [Saitozyma podzolica]